MAAKIQGVIAGKRRLPSGEIKVKPFSSSKEERVARINLRQAIVVSIITTFATAVTTLATIFINKTSENSIDSMVKHREAKVQVMSDQLKERDKELNNVKREIQTRIDNEINPNKKKELNYLKDRVDEVINYNGQVFPLIYSGAIESVINLKQKNFVLAEMNREATLVKLFEETKSRQILITLLTPYNLRNIIDPNFILITNEVGSFTNRTGTSIPRVLEYESENYLNKAIKIFDESINLSRERLDLNEFNVINADKSIKSYLAEKGGSSGPNSSWIGKRSVDKRPIEGEAVGNALSGNHFSKVLADELANHNDILTMDNFEGGQTLDKLIKKPIMNGDDINRLKERNSANAIRFTVGRTF